MWFSPSLREKWHTHPSKACYLSTVGAAVYFHENVIHGLAQVGFPVGHTGQHPTERAVVRSKAFTAVQAMVVATIMADSMLPV